MVLSQGFHRALELLDVTIHVRLRPASIAACRADCLLPLPASAALIPAGPRRAQLRLEAGERLLRLVRARLAVRGAHHQLVHAPLKGAPLRLRRLRPRPQRLPLPLERHQLLLHRRPLLQHPLHHRPRLLQLALQLLPGHLRLPRRVPQLLRLLRQRRLELQPQRVPLCLQRRGPPRRRRARDRLRGEPLRLCRKGPRGLRIGAGGCGTPLRGKHAVVGALS
mmetsp:Transcript_24986/g.59480  ORF Transcript_24986/g.59480 Transcript_24986/m.59480 type:complete len:222 (-) Transcript_24986:226-891(-)